MPEGRRIVVVIEYEAESLHPEIMAEIGSLVRERIADEPIPHARFVGARAALGVTAFRVVEALGDRK